MQSICQYPVIIASTYAAGTNFTTPASLGEIAVTNTEDYKQASTGDGFTAALYPNPASSGTTLNVKGNKGAYTIMLQSLQGELLWKAEDVTDGNVRLPLNKLASGV